MVMDYSELKEKLKDVPVPRFVQDQEPDQDSYTDKEYSSRVMASDEFKRDYDEFLESVRGKS
jgi:hypothetical protein